MAEPLRSTNEGSRVRILSQRSAEPMEEPASKPSNQAFLATAMGVMTAIATILAVRVLLLLSGAGAFALHYLAVGSPDMMKLATAGAYDLLVFIPLIYLYVTRG